MPKIEKSTLKKLNHYDSKIRIRGINELPKYGDMAVPHLVKQLEDKEHTVKEYALSALGETHSKKAFSHIINELGSGVGVHHSALSALGELGDKRAIPYLIDNLSTNMESHAKVAAESLLKIEPKKAKKEFKKHLIHSKLHTINSFEGIVQVLLEEGGEDSKKILMDARQEATWDHNQKKLDRAIERFDDIKPHITTLKTKSGHNWQNIAKAQNIIERFGEDAIPHMKKIFDENDEYVKQYGASILGTVGGNEATNILINQLKTDKMERTRMNCVQALGEIGGKKAIEAIEYALNNDSHKWVITHAAEALLDLGEKKKVEKALPIIRKLAFGEDHWGAESAYKLLIQLQGKKAEVDLVKLLNRKQWGNTWKMNLVRELGVMGSDKAIPYLTKELKTESKSKHNSDLRKLRMEIIQELGVIGTNEALQQVVNALAFKDEKLNIVITDVFKQHRGDDMLPFIINAHHEMKDSESRKAIEDILEEIGDTN